MSNINSKRRSTKDGVSQTVDISTRLKSSERRPCRPSIGRSLFRRIVYHGSTVQREANHLGFSEPEAYAILRMQIVDRLNEERRLGFSEGRMESLMNQGRRVAA